MPSPTPRLSLLTKFSNALIFIFYKSKIPVRMSAWSKYTSAALSLSFAERHWKYLAWMEV